MTFGRCDETTPRCARGGGAAIALLAVTAAGAWAAGCGAGGDGARSASAEPAGEAIAASGVGSPALGLVEVRITEKGYEPARIPARVNETVTLRVTRTTERTCATELIMKDPPLRKDLPLGKAVEISLTPSRTGEISFSCAMDMVGGVIDVR